MNTCFALLDDNDVTATAPMSRLYTGYLDTLHCHDSNELSVVLARMTSELHHGRHAIVLFSYELGAALQQIPTTVLQPPLASILFFEHCEHLNSTDVTHWLTAQQAIYVDAVSSTLAGPDVAGIANVRPGIDEEQFHDALSRIHDYIVAGDTYQINYTWQLCFDVWGSPFQLYRQLRARQPVPYGALIRLPDQRMILSCSPELFMHHQHGQMRVQPMKGTAAAAHPAGITPQQREECAKENARRATALATDEKCRAENLMIVDLLRNDLGRVAIPGSVSVPHLFEVHTYGDVLQMTSTIMAQLRPEASLFDVISALYPCGSITGAPKRRAMQIIHELETMPRGLYTGALGWFDGNNGQENSNIPDFCLSVPIRTLVLQAPHAGVRAGTMGIGAGIVYDSDSHDEYAECLLKATFLTALEKPFSLFETMHATREDGCRHLHLHLQRLRHSAQVFGFLFDESALHSALLEKCATLPTGVPHRMKLTLAPDGQYHLHAAILSAIDTPVKVFIARHTCTSQDFFLRHKTSMRDFYDLAWQTAEAYDGFDMLFFNERGELTEGGRSNVLVQLDGHWYTPPLNAGLLPGVMRTVLLADPAWSVQERIISLADLQQATGILLCNALRGTLPAFIDWQFSEKPMPPASSS